MKYKIMRKIDKLGRIVLPMDFRKALGLEKEAEVNVSIIGNTITIKSIGKICKLCGESHKNLSVIGICPNCIKRVKELAV